MQNSLGIYSKRCWVNNSFTEATILFKDGKITEVITGQYPHNDMMIIDFGDDVIMPGAIDAHVHINEPGRTEWEGFETATRAAATGGVTTIVDMPLNSNPVTTTVETFKQKLKATKDKLTVNCGFYGGLIPDNVSEVEALINEGVLGIKAFLTHSGIDDFPNVEKKDLEAAMPLIAKHGARLLVHCELTDAKVTLPVSLDSNSYLQYLNSRPKRWENEAVLLMIELCENYNCPVHIVHVSSAEALPLIQKAKEKGLPLTAETCPHYIYFHAEAIPDGNTLFKCAPPIRELSNNLKLIEALKNGLLDFIATDHSPAPSDLKEMDTGNLTKAWGGISGLQYFISAAWTRLKANMTIDNFIPLVTEHPAKFLNINDHKGSLKPGMDADFTIWKPEAPFLVKQEANQHKHKISPYIGEELFGKIVSTWVNGVEVFNQSLTNKKPGTWIIKNQK